MIKNKVTLKSRIFLHHPANGDMLYEHVIKIEKYPRLGNLKKIELKISKNKVNWKIFEFIL